jgi:hypothetical protein
MVCHTSIVFENITVHHLKLKPAALYHPRCIRFCMTESCNFVGPVRICSSIFTFAVHEMRGEEREIVAACVMHYTT